MSSLLTQPSVGRLNPLESPTNTGCTTPAVVGKSFDSVQPVANRLPLLSKARLRPASRLLPPKQVENNNAPVGEYSWMKTSAERGCAAATQAVVIMSVMKKSGAPVLPITKMLFAASTTMPRISSKGWKASLPPTNVEKTRALPSGGSLARKPSSTGPAYVASTAFTVGKSGEAVRPPTMMLPSESSSRFCGNSLPFPPR